MPILAPFIIDFKNEVEETTDIINELSEVDAIVEEIQDTIKFDHYNTKKSDLLIHYVSFFQTPLIKFIYSSVS